MNDLCRNLAKDRQLKEYAIHLIDKYVDTLRKMGHDNVIGSYTGYEKIKNNVDEKCIQRLINHLKPAITTISNLEHENELNIYDQKESFYLKRFLFLNKLHTNYNLDEILDESDVIEIYDFNHIQMYRSFNFFQYCSYSFEEIFTNEWWRLFKRSIFVTNKIIETADNILTQQLIEIQHVNCPDHWVDETNSKHNFGCYVRQRIMIPLLNEKNKVVAVIAPFNVIKYRDQNGNIVNLKEVTIH
ncbi:MAG: hypothetical protein A2381_14900 [Bdellovibrionales bacterium RIFOXYB1_FULL_37_110]|nr:MAG: hypothetical protein A2417_10405 [Bdellovibrionales bacterium RIFOXYC1_FULL_37_79]OFZ60153.1 MAG: hypothetical protein A2381_14900 [Bdellovibrionales bacterium RIFOXYB1_FULL_37_110]OFZ64353.1 MAG: hypothetical protein A2577_09870 [Bdellovibrionales bacterium RIFOXYD1_FULL_36_51]